MVWAQEFLGRQSIRRRLAFAFAALWSTLLVSVVSALLGSSGGALAALVVASVLAAWATRAVARSITDPVEACARGLEALGQGAPVALDEIPGDHELARLARAVEEASVTLGSAATASQPAEPEPERHSTRDLRANVDALLVAVQAVAQGDLTAEVPHTEDPTVARISEALEQLFASLRDSLGAFARGAHSLSGAAGSVTELGTEMGEDARRTSERADRVTATAREVNDKVRAVSDRAEDLLISVQDIYDNTSDAAEVAAQGVKLLEQTDSAFERLKASSEQIDDVIKLITTIAAQTNLLALNATIEAAKAGAAGRGFAVVAREVKDLANASGAAAEKVAGQIQTIQRDTTGAAEALAQIRDVISKIDAAQSSIASAVQQQSQTTSYITMNMSEAASASGRIVESIGTVGEAAAHTKERASASLEAAHDLARLASELQGLLEHFTYAEGGAGGHDLRVA